MRSQDVRWLWPLLPIGAAVVLDWQRLHSGRTAAPVPLAVERDGLPGLVRYAGFGLPWTPLLVTRYVSLRRSAWYSHDDGLLSELDEIRRQLDAADTASAWRPWRGFGRISRERSRSALRFWPLVLWAVVVLPAAIYYGLGTVPGAAGVQRSLSDHRSLFITLLVLPVALGLVLLAWQFFVGVRALPTARSAPCADGATHI